MNESYPFSAIVGMDLAKTALLLHAVNPRLGGVLLSGHRGCAKTTLARAFADLLPDAAACELPLGASEDRLLGSVDVAGVLERNEWSHQAGLLEQANGGILFVDEVNLLPDALSDQLLDAAATGEYQLEREGMSRRIESRFILIGTMNPEEGLLRPQLADRFAHTICITTDSGVADRRSVIERRLSFETDAAAFCKTYAAQDLALRLSIAQAKIKLPQVNLSKELMTEIAARAEALQMEGMRGGLAVAKTAMAAAAWAKRNEVNAEDVDLAWRLCKGEDQGDENESPPATDSGQSQTEQEQGNRSFVSLQPSGASGDALEQRAGTEKVDELLQTLMTKVQLAGLANKSSASERPALIHWKDTVLGWVRDGRRERLRRWDQRKKRHLWVFLDASRSSGADRFLEKSLTLLTQSLRGAGMHSLKIHVLKLSAGKVSWLGRDMIASAAEKVLNELFSARGESCLGTAFMELLRDARRRGASAGDSVVLFCDGIVTVPRGESVDSMQAVMKGHLARVARMGPEILWCAPPIKRGFLHPVDTLGIRSICESSSI